jgi:hypothetical protein
MQKYAKMDCLLLLHQLNKLEHVIKLDHSFWCLGTKTFLFNNILLDLDL